MVERVITRQMRHRAARAVVLVGEKVKQEEREQRDKETLGAQMETTLPEPMVGRVEGELAQLAQIQLLALQRRAVPEQRVPYRGPQLRMQAVAVAERCREEREQVERGAEETEELEWEQQVQTPQLTRVVVVVVATVTEQAVQEGLVLWLFRQR